MSPDTEHFDVRWIDRGREPKCPANPDFPNGTHVNGAGPGKVCCTVDLPYPAKRIGYYDIRCKLCSHSMMLTTAGRADDPVTITLPCKVARKPGQA